MPAKKTIEDVRAVFEERGYSLLSAEYVNARTKLDYICPEGHKGSIVFDSFRRGSGCHKCSRAKVASAQKNDFNKVKSFFAKEGYTLISTEEDYKNSASKLKCVCPEGHHTAISYNNFSRGRRCKVCKGIHSSERQRTDFSIVKAAFVKAGYTLFSGEDTFKNQHSKLKYICPEGHEGTVSFDLFKSGTRCPKCSSKKRGMERRVPFEQVVAVFEKEGYKVLSDSSVYENGRTRLEYECPVGHRGLLSYSSFKQGRRCQTCSRKRYIESMRVSFDKVTALFEQYGYTLLAHPSDYTSQYDRLKYICPRGHRGSMSYTNFKQGKRCPACFGGVSRAELELRDFVVGLVGEEQVSHNNRSLIAPLELDIYVPSKKLAIEYCGLYWHSEIAGGKPRNYHRMKLDMCTERGVRLITIFEDEYLNKPDVVKSRIANALGCIEKRIYARECTVSIIDNSTANVFLDRYHLQGRSRAKVSFGLFFDGELLQVLTLGSVSRGHASKVNGYKVEMLELKRFSSKPYVVVVGGAGKLFSAAKKFAISNGFNYIKSYSDSRYANVTSSVYDTLGFSCVGETKYTPHYILNNTRFRNQSLRKTPEERLTGKTEWELRSEQGYDRIWDCGHKTYLYEL